MIYKNFILITIGALSLSSLYAGESNNVYLGDKFNPRHSNVNESFVKTMAKNRAYTDANGASYTKIDGKEELQKALETGQLNQELNGNRITQEYKHIEINNARINKNDLKNMKGDNLLIGSKVTQEKQRVMQSIDMKNSKIDTDKHINIGIVSSVKNNSGITSINKIQGSSLIGGNKLKKSSSRDKKESISLIDD
ncbi:MAG TPA: hypothetical protein EYM49_02055 [Campylobacterales bacterium]|nr:hypothetical protein [Campylobacterales bacterium]